MIKNEIEISELDGSWENKNRNITAAAFAGLIGIGVIFFNVQSILSLVLIAFFSHFNHIEIAGTYIEKIRIITTSLKTPILISLVISEFLFMLYPTIWIIKKWHTKKVKKYIRLKLCSFKEILLAVAITVSLLPTCYFIGNLIIKSLHIPEVLQEVGSQLFSADSGWQFLMIIFVVAVTPAICEEIFFRGYVQRTLERTLGVKSIFITGILFGLFHMRPLNLIILSILGILFSFFYYRSKSILPSSAAHFTNNLIAISIIFFQSKSFTLNLPTNNWMMFLYLTGSILLGVMLFIIYLRLTSNHQTEYN